MDSRASVPAFSQSKASFSAMPRSFMLFSNTDMISCGGAGGGEDREVTPGASQEEQAVAGIAGVGGREGLSRTGWMEKRHWKEKGTLIFQ